MRIVLSKSYTFDHLKARANMFGRKIEAGRRPKVTA